MSAMRWNLMRHITSYKRREQEKKENSMGPTYKSPLDKGKKKNQLENSYQLHFQYIPAFAGPQDHCFK